MPPKRAARGSTTPAPKGKRLRTISEVSSYESDSPPPAPRKPLAKHMITDPDSEPDEDDSDVDFDADDFDDEDIETEVEGSQDGAEELEQLEESASDDGAVEEEEEEEEEEEKEYVPFRIRCAFRIPPPPKSGRFCKKWASRPIGGNPLRYCHLHWPKRDLAQWPANPRKRRDLVTYDGRLRKNDPNAPDYGSRGRPVGTRT